MARPDRDKTERERPSDVAPGAEPFAVIDEIQCLQAEGRECRKATADSNHDELPGRGPNEDAAIRAGQGAEESDDKRTDYVDRQGSPRKRFPHQACRNTG